MKKLARKKTMRRKIIRWSLVASCIMIAVIFAALLFCGDLYLSWNLHDPETAVLSVAFHTFEWLFVRTAPIILAKFAGHRPRLHSEEGMISM